MFKKFWNKNKDKPLFKGKVLAVILVIIAVIVNWFSLKGDENHSEDIPPQSSQSEEEKGIHIGWSNIAVLGVCIAALAYVKHKDNNIGKK